MKLCIERMTLRLPAGFEEQAPDIAREFARHLAELAPEHSLDLERVEIPPLRVAPGTTASDIARAAAAAVAAGIGGQP